MQGLPIGIDDLPKFAKGITVLTDEKSAGSTPSD